MPMGLGLGIGLSFTGVAGGAGDTSPGGAVDVLTDDDDAIGLTDDDGSTFLTDG